MNRCNPANFVTEVKYLSVEFGIITDRWTVELDGFT